MFDAVRGRIAGLVLTYLEASRIARGKWRIAQLASRLLDGVPVRSASGPRVVANFLDSTFWLMARGSDPVKDTMSRVRAGDVVIDVGANIGMMSLIAVERGAVAIAIEASHREFGRLLANRALLDSDGQRRLIPLQVAAGPRDGLTQFRTNELAHSGGSSLGPARKPSDQSFIVPMMRIDSIVRHLPDELMPVWEAALRTRRIVVKIDVEGYEMEALEGMSDLLSTRCCRVIVEMNSGRAQRLGTGVGIEQFMHSHGYRPTIEVAGREHYDQVFVPDER